MFSIGRFYFYLLLVAVVSGQGKQTLRWGGELALKLNTPPPPDSSILWKHKANKVVEYDRDFSDQGITAYGEFRGRATLDKTTGMMTVTSLTKADNGVYTVEYNSKLQPETFTISVLSQGEQILRWGGELVIHVDTPPPPDSSILWKHNANKVVEYDRDFSDQGITDYSLFKGRAKLNRTTGTLTVTSLTKADDGVYSVEYNSKLQPKTFTISVLRAVPKPTIQIPPSCNPPSCNLTCEGNTTDAGDVSYSWKMGDGQMTVSQMTLQITSEDPSPITCQLTNQLGVEVSDPVQNPLHQSGGSAGIILSILAVIVVIGVVIAFWKVPSLRKRVSNLFQQLRNAPVPSNPTTTYDVVGGNLKGNGTPTDTNDGNASAVVVEQPSPEEVPQNTVKTPDLNENIEDRQDNGIPDIPPESAPLIDRLHKDDSNNTSKTVTEAILSEPEDPGTAVDATAKIDGSTSVVSVTPGNDATTGTEPAVGVAIEGSTSASPGTGGPGGGGSEKGVDSDPIIRMESSQSYAPKEDRPANDTETGPLKKSDDEDKGDAESKKL